MFTFLRESKTLQRLHRRVEILRVSATPRAGRETPVPRLVRRGKDYAVWEVQTAIRKVFMIAESTKVDDQLFVVHCDAERFYLAWLRAGGFCVPRSRMSADRRFMGATEGFMKGEINPVPLANVAVDTWTGRERMDCIAGITRTYWLLANHAKSFPVYVQGAVAADAAHRIAGIGPAPQSFERIFSESLNQ